MNKYSVLIVDDSEADRYLLKRDLKGIKNITHVHEASNGKEALDFLTNHENNSKQYPNKFPPLFIFFDINMPVIDGFGFLKGFDEIKDGYENYDSIIFIMFTTSQLQQEIDLALSYEFVKEYLIKGDIDKTTLKERLSKYH